MTQPPARGRRPRSVALATVAVLTALATTSASLAAQATPARQATPPALAPAAWFERVATYPVFENLPGGADPADETVAEISAVTDDGNTMIYTDAPGKRVGFLDISDPARPVGRGTIDLTELGDADDQPTSVAVLGQHVLVAVDTSGGDFDAPSGRLDVIRIADRAVVRSLDLGGQPDSVAVSPDLEHVAVAMENQRDEDAVADGGVGEEGDLPQAPAGFVQVLDVPDPTAPAGWLLTKVDGKKVRKVSLRSGRAKLKVRLPLGTHRVVAVYSGSTTSARSRSPKVKVRVVDRH